MNTKSKGILVLSVLCAILLLVPSCQKKASPSQSSTKVEQSTQAVSVKAESEKKSEVAPVSSKAEEPVKEKEAAEPVKEAAAESAKEVSSSAPAPVEAKTEEVAKAEVKAEEPVKDDELVYEDTLSYKGLSLSVKLADDNAVLTLPSSVSEEDVKTVAAAVCAAFPNEASNVTYSYDNNVLTLNYPEQSGEYLLSALAVLKSEAVSFLDSLLSEAEVEETLVVSDVTEDASSAIVLKVEDNDAVYSEALSYMGLTTDVAVYNDHAVLTLPEGFGEETVSYLAELVCELYPEETAEVYFGFAEDGALVVYYPEQSDEYILSAVETVKAEAISFIDDTVSAIEETISEAVASAVEALNITVEEKDGLLFVVRFSYNGYESEITVSSSEATLTIPEGVTAEDIAAVAEVVCEAFPEETSEITYALDGDKLVVAYPEQTAEYLESVLVYLASEAEELLDQYPMETSEPEVAVAEEKTEEVQAAAAPEEVKSEEAPATPAPVAPAPVAPAPVAPVAPVAAPVAVEEDAFKGFSIAATAGGKYNFKYKDNGFDSGFVGSFALRAEAQLNSFAFGLKAQYDLTKYADASLYARWMFLESGKFDVYVLGGAGVCLSIDNLKDVGFFGEVALGADWSILDNLALFGEVTGQYSYKKPGIEAGVTMGARFTF